MGAAVFPVVDFSTVVRMVRGFLNHPKLFVCKGFHLGVWLVRGAFQNWIPVFGGFVFPTLE